MALDALLEIELKSAPVSSFAVRVWFDLISSLGLTGFFIASSFFPGCHTVEIGSSCKNELITFLMVFKFFANLTQIPNLSSVFQLCCALLLLLFVIFGKNKAKPSFYQ